MAAQSGSGIVLSYGQQGARQQGGGLVLSFDALPSATRRLAASTSGCWRQSAAVRLAAEAVLPAAQKAPSKVTIDWRASAMAIHRKCSPWVRTAPRERGGLLPWGSYGRLGKKPQRAGWRDSRYLDESGGGRWRVFGPSELADVGGGWVTSIPRDQFRAASWRGFRIELWVAVPYVPPVCSAADFSVVGGSPMQIVFNPPAGGFALPLVAQFGADAYSPHWLGDPLRNIVRPDCGAVDFGVGKVARRIVLGEDGAALKLPSSRDAARLNPWGRSQPKTAEKLLPWLRYSRPMNPGWGIVVPGTPMPPEPGQTITIPVRRVYFVVNETLLVRAQDSSPIPAVSLSIGFDCDSWLPSFSATIPAEARDLVMPAPDAVEIAAFVNGTEFRFLVEKVSRSRQFGQNSVAISGRSVACELDSPYAAASQHGNATAMTAQQLIDAALTNTGYTQDWRITDWLVPAGAMSLSGTPAAVAGHVAEAAGAVLAADWATRTLRMLPRYSTKPWEWAAATPDYVIPAAVAQTDSLEWQEKPAYNVVFVAGVQQGVVGQVKIAGTAGDAPAPMVTHPLITHVDAARQRGISILGDTGRKAMLQISLPVLDDAGIIDICRLVEFSDGGNTRRGIVRGNQISVNFPTVRQTITVEASA